MLQLHTIKPNPGAKHRKKRLGNGESSGLGKTCGKGNKGHNVFYMLPLLLGMLFQQFYSMVDTIIVGKFLGAKALAAVGSTGSINFMIVGFCMGICNGFAIPVAQMFGAGDRKALCRYVGNGAVLAGLFSVVMTVLVCIWCRDILVLMKTPSDILDGAYAYIFVIFLGIPLMVLYNQTSAIMRSLGDSRSPLIFLGISSVLNIVLDLVLVRPMGVAGTAWATIIAQGISGFLCLFYMKKKFTILTFQREDWKLHKHYVINLCNMGIPMGLQYSITAIGSVILQSAVNTLGSNAVASMTAGSKIGMFFCCPFDAMGSTMATYGGQNVGAKKMDRISKGLKACSMLGIGYAILAFVILSLTGRNLALFFVERAEVEVIGNVYLFLLINSAFYIPLAFVNIVRFLIQGMGYSKFAILAGVCEMAARTLVGFALVPLFGFPAACFASPVAWIFADAFLFPAYLSRRAHRTEYEGL